MRVLAYQTSSLLLNSSEFQTGSDFTPPPTPSPQNENLKSPRRLRLKLIHKYYIIKKDKYRQKNKCKSEQNEVAHREVVLISHK